MDNFIRNFANQWDETAPDFFKPETEFRKIDEWSSLVGLAILNMIWKKYCVKLSPEEFMVCKTLQDVFNKVNENKHE